MNSTSLVLNGPINTHCSLNLSRNPKSIQTTRFLDLRFSFHFLKKSPPRAKRFSSSVVQLRNYNDDDDSDEFRSTLGCRLRTRVSSNGNQFGLAPEDNETQEPNFLEFITSERIKVVAMLALALALCNADRVVMLVAIVPLSDAYGWNRSFSGIVQARECLELNEEESESVSRLTIHPHRAGGDVSFYEHFCLRGIRVDRVEPGFVTCTFKVPPRLIDKNGNLANGAIASLVDRVGGAVVQVEGLLFGLKVSVDMSISFVSTAKFNDELEITSRLLGQRGNYSGTLVIVRNKATGEIIAEGRHSLLGGPTSKM